eukprot:SAG22_NODE_10239_length_546_cov_0.653244_1_plen_106_part_10
MPCRSNGPPYWVPREFERATNTTAPLDIVVIMLGTNDAKRPSCGRPPAAPLSTWSGRSAGFRRSDPRLFLPNATNGGCDVPRGGPDGCKVAGCHPNDAGHHAIAVV